MYISPFIGHHERAPEPINRINIDLKSAFLLS